MRVLYKPFEKVPTLKKYPLIGHSYLFLPFGKYKVERLTEAFVDISKTLGPIFKLNLGGSNMIITLNPNDSAILFQNEGKYPKRPIFEALLHYRTKTFGSIGVVPGNGPSWYFYRKGVTPLLSTKFIEPYKAKQREIALNFVKYIKEKRNDDFILTDLYSQLLKFTIEAISIVSPGCHLDCLLEENEEAQIIIKATIQFMNGLYRTLIEPPLWKFFPTKGYQLLVESHESILNVLENHLKEIEKQFDGDTNYLKEMNPFMFSLFNNKNFSWNDKLVAAMEIFFGGIDATATTLTFTLLSLARNSQLQEIASQSDEFFLKACIKETLRLWPTAGGNSRFLTRDVIMSNYFIPQGTLVLSLNSGLALNEEIYENATNYNPQRFLDAEKQFHKYASLPFGYGARMCPGKRLAENEILICLQQILKHFRVADVDNETVGMVFRMNRIPDKAVNLKFIDK